jgi:hypothetical protein
MLYFCVTYFIGYMALLLLIMMMLYYDLHNCRAYICTDTVTRVLDLPVNTPAKLIQPLDHYHGNGIMATLFQLCTST